MIDLLVDAEVRAEHVARDHEVVLDTIDGEPVHAQILRQQRVAMSLHHELNGDADVASTLNGTRNK